MEDEGEDADLTPMLIIMLTVALIFLLFVYPASRSNVFLFNADL